MAQEKSAQSGCLGARVRLSLGHSKEQLERGTTLFLDGQGTKSNAKMVGSHRDSLLHTKDLILRAIKRWKNGQEPEETQINPYLQESVVGNGARPPYSRWLKRERNENHIHNSNQPFIVS